jgi:hypothetical protein
MISTKGRCFWEGSFYASGAPETGADWPFDQTSVGNIRIRRIGGWNAPAPLEPWRQEALLNRSIRPAD